MNVYKNLAQDNNLRKYRKEKGFTQRDLAWVCRQTDSEIRKYEAGSRMPNYPILRKIARILDVSIEKIYPQVKEIDEEVDRIKEIMERKFQSKNI
jgi:transcriptional regulator with XRE-family HTH domain